MKRCLVLAAGSFRIDSPNPPGLLVRDPATPVARQVTFF
jgi:hypothetical protein